MLFRSDNDNKLKKNYEAFQNMDGRFHIFEHRIPVDEQLGYFSYSAKMRKKNKVIDDSVCDLFEVGLESEGVLIDDKRDILTYLASSKHVRAYRLLENYSLNPDKELANWAYMALMESRITLENELSGEKQIFITSGLGGKGENIRFYALVISSGGQTFADYQRDVIEKEFRYAMQSNDCEIERLTICDKSAEIVFLVPFRSDIKKFFDGIIRGCNLYGNFLSEICTITNVKELTKEEVDKVVEKYGNIQAGS